MSVEEMTFADALRRFRKTFGLKQIDVAKTLGVSQQNYQAYENKSIPNAAMLRKISREYGVTVDYLIGLDDEPCRSTIVSTVEDINDQEIEELTIAAENARILDYHKILTNILAKQGIKI